MARGVCLCWVANEQNNRFGAAVSQVVSAGGSWELPVGVCVKILWGVDGNVFRTAGVSPALFFFIAFKTVFEPRLAVRDGSCLNCGVRLTTLGKDAKRVTDSGGTTVQ